MKLKPIIAAGALAASLGLSSVASAATVDYVVDAKTNSINTDKLNRGLATVSLVAGEAFSITTDILDLWSVGVGAARVGNAEGAASFRPLTSFGVTFNHGTLVGRVGDGEFFKVGLAVSRLADATGILKLYMWDRNFGDNTGTITASITTGIAPVPLAASAPMLLAALGGLALFRRRKA